MPKISDEDKIKLLEDNPYLDGSKRFFNWGGYQIDTWFDNIDPRFLEILPSKVKATLEKDIARYKKFSAQYQSLKEKVYGLKVGPTSEHRYFKVLNPYKIFIIELYGRFFTDQEVLNKLLEEKGIKVSKNTLKKYKDSVSDDIAKARIEHMEDPSGLRLYHKKSRLEELEWLFNHRKGKYKVSESASDYKLLIDTLKIIRDEATDGLTKSEVNVNMNVTTTINTALVEDLMNKLPVLMLVIARVAVKNNINPLFILYKLKNSIYSKFTGLSEPGGDIFEDPVEYPTSIAFNLDNMRSLYEKSALKDEEYKQKLIYRPSSKAKLQELKAKFKNLK